MSFTMIAVPAIIAATFLGAAGPGAASSRELVVVAFGDSTTAVRATVPKVYAQILQEQLPALLGQPVTVCNAGIGGNRTDQALSRLSADVLSKHPHLVIVQFGINDSWIDSGQTASRVPLDATSQAASPHGSRGNYTDNLTRIVGSLKRAGIRVILMTPNQLNTVGAGSVEVWRNDLLGTYAQAVRDVAAREEVELLDVWRIYAAYAAIPGNSIADLLVDPHSHPGDRGHQMVAEGLIRMLRQRKAAIRRK